MTLIIASLIISTIGGYAYTRRRALTTWLREPRPMKSDTTLDKAKVTLAVAVIIAATFGIPYVLGWSPS